MYKVLGHIIYWFCRPILIAWLSRGSRAYVLIEANGNFLLTRNWLGSGKWSLPGGGQKKGESPIDTIVREAKEEVGVRLDRERLAKLGAGIEKYFLGSRNYTLYKTVYRNKPIITLNKKELTGYCWVSRDDVNNLKVSQDIRDAVQLTT